MKSIIIGLIVLAATLLINLGIYFKVDASVYVLNALAVLAFLLSLYSLCAEPNKIRAHVRRFLSDYETPSIGELFIKGLSALVALPCIPLLLIGGYYKTTLALLIVAWVATISRNRMNVYIHNFAKCYVK